MLTKVAVPVEAVTDQAKHPLQTMAMAAAAASTATDVDASFVPMLGLSEIGKDGKRTGVVDRLNAKGMDIDAKVIHEDIRGTYSIKEVTAGNEPVVVLQRHQLAISMDELWETIIIPEYPAPMSAAASAKASPTAKPKAKAGDTTSAEPEAKTDKDAAIGSLCSITLDKFLEEWRPLLGKIEAFGFNLSWL